MSEKTLKFNNIKLNKKELHKSKQPIDSKSANVDQIVVSGRFKHSGDGLKYFIGYQEGEIVKSLCINLPQMSGYIKYFGGKTVETVKKTCLSWLKMTMCWINLVKFGIRLKKR